MCGGRGTGSSAVQNTFVNCGGKTCVGVMSSHKGGGRTQMQKRPRWILGMSFTQIEKSHLRIAARNRRRIHIEVLGAIWIVCVARVKGRPFRIWRRRKPASVSMPMTERCDTNTDRIIVRFDDSGRQPWVNVDDAGPVQVTTAFYRPSRTRSRASSASAPPFDVR
eukprot:6197793-Pleurochrysis_carterae.AAC.2